MNGVLGASNELSLSRLKRALEAHSGFQLILLEAPEGATREQVLEIIMSWAGREGISQLRRLRARASTKIVSRLRSKVGGVLLEDIDSALFDDLAVDRLVGALNWQRDQLRRRIRGPLILVTSARGAARLFEKAPDLVTWRSHTCRIMPFADESVFEQRVEKVFEALDPDPIEVERIEILLSRLAEEHTPPEELASLWIRAGNAYRRGSSLDQARKAYLEAERIAPRDGRVYPWSLFRIAGLDLECEQINDAQVGLKALAPFLDATKDRSLYTLCLSLRADLAELHDEMQESILLRRAAVDSAGNESFLRERMQYHLAATLYRQGESEEAREILEELYNLDDPRLYVQSYELTARIEYKRNRPDLAVALLRQALAKVKVVPGLSQDYASVALKLGLLLISIDQPRAARKLFREVRPLLVNSTADMRADAVVGEGLSALRAGHRSCVQLLETAARLTKGKSEEAMILLMLAAARASQGDLGGARRSARIGMQLIRDSGLEPEARWFQPVWEALSSSEDAATPGS